MQILEIILGIVGALYGIIFTFGIAVAVILASYYILTFMKIPKKIVIFLSFFICGAVKGYLAAEIWPNEGGIYFSVLGVLLGDEIYDRAPRESTGEMICTPVVILTPNGGSYEANYTECHPVYRVKYSVLDLPNVYILSSIIIWSLFGLVAQIIYNRRRSSQL